MRWFSFIGFLIGTVAIGSCAAEQTIRTQRSSECLASTQAGDPLLIQHGTLAIVILETNQIVIAIDSRVTANRVGLTNSFEDEIEKVIPLSPRIAFFQTGAGRFVTHEGTNSLIEIAKEVLAEREAAHRMLRLDELAQGFQTRAETHLSRLTIGDIHFLHQIAMKEGGTNAFNAYLLGQDADGEFRMFRVTCDALSETNAGKLNARLAFNVMEEKRTGKQQIFFLGANKVFGDGLNDPAAPLAPFMKQLRRSQLLAEPAAAALVAAGVREYGDDVKSPVGYPVFVYTLGADGFRMTRKVKKGETVPFDPRNQGK